MAGIYNVVESKLVAVEIILITDRIPLTDINWQFDWARLIGNNKAKTYVLKLKEEPKSIEGVIQLLEVNGMLIMNLLEIAPHNIGSKTKRYDFVAGCLIAFACRESFKIEGDYKGFLSFVSKSGLIFWYKEKYGATQVLGQRMFFDDAAGKMLIKKFLE